MKLKWIQGINCFVLQKKYFCVLFSLCLVLWAVQGFAEDFELKSGKVFSGKVIFQNDKEIQLETANGLMTVPRRMLAVKGESQEISHHKSLNILFIGNSYTYANDLPEIFSKLVRAQGGRVKVSTAANPGWKLAQHLKSKYTLAKINKHNWDYVILQEQSVVPAFSKARFQIFYPAVKKLDKKIKSVGGKTILMMTWGRRDGLKSSGFKNYSEMQSALYQGYMGIANTINAIVAPVGMAWKSVVKSGAVINLWQGDGSHPSLSGSYLAACVLYSVIYESSPEGSYYTARLGSSKANYLQKKAATVVLKNLKRWK